MKRKKKNSTTLDRITGRKWLDCTSCQTPVMVGDDTSAVTCSSCVADMMPAPEEKTASVKEPIKYITSKSGVPVRDPDQPKRKRGRPRIHPVKPPSLSLGWGRGWHKKRHFEAPNGKTYSFGQEVT